MSASFTSPLRSPEELPLEMRLALTKRLLAQPPVPLEQGDRLRAMYNKNYAKMMSLDDRWNIVTKEERQLAYKQLAHLPIATREVILRQTKMRQLGLVDQRDNWAHQPIFPPLSEFLSTINKSRC